MSDVIAGSKARFGRFNVDLTTGKLQRSGLNVPIQTKPFQVLRLLLIADGQVVSRDQLRAALWAEDTFVDFEHGLNTAVRKLRQALEDSAEDPKFIETIPRLGYRFMASVEWAPEEPVRKGDELPAVQVRDQVETWNAPNRKPSCGNSHPGHGRSLVHRLESLYPEFS